MVRVVQVREFSAHPLRGLEYVGELRPILPLEPEDPVEAGAYLLESIGIVIDRRGVVPHPLADVLEPVEDLGKAFHLRLEFRVEGREALKQLKDRRQPVRQSVLAIVQDLVNPARSVGQLFTVFVPTGLGFEGAVFAWCKIGLVDLSELEPQEVRPAFDLPNTLLSLFDFMAEDLEFGILVGDPTSDRLGTTIRIEDGALIPLTEKRLVFVLPVQVDERTTHFSHDPGGSRRTTHPGSITAGGRDFSPQNQEAFFQPEAVGLEDLVHGRHPFDIEDGFDRRSLRSGSHDSCRSALPQEERQRPHDDRLARPRLAGQGVEAGAQIEGEILDDGVVTDAKFNEHGRAI